jgi:hypothetical protein
MIQYTWAAIFSSETGTLLLTGCGLLLTGVLLRLILSAFGHVGREGLNEAARLNDDSNPRRTSPVT